MNDVRALIFDVFGTLVDWRTSVAREARSLLQGRSVDGEAFADAWRAQYQPVMEEVRSGRVPFSKLDALHRIGLERVLRDFGLADVDEATRTELNLAWHRLDAWPDVTPGLARLRQRFRVAPCSNGNISLMADLARRHGWHWDAIAGAELARDYKPKPVGLPERGGGVRLRPGAGADGGCAFVGPRRCGCSGTAHRLHRPARRAWAGAR